MVQRLTINSEVLLEYIRRSNIPMKLLQQSLPRIDQFLSGETGPTFNQLVKLAKLINVPVGLLVLSQPVQSIDVAVDFRTLDSKQVTEMSPELRDTILEMQEKQEFLIEVVESDCPFVGEFDLNSDKAKVVEKIRNYLGNELTHNRFENYRKRLGDLGVFVFLNGKYKDNTRRPLNLKEFRGFVLSDKRAPIIFINQLDSRAGRLFTLIHEFVHLFYGGNDLFNDEASTSHNQVEAVVNSITAEILVPESLVVELFDSNHDIQENLKLISHRCEVSKFVVLRRLFDLSFISKSVYISLYKKLELEFKELSKVTRISTGGNYNNNLKYRIDNNFFTYVNNAVKQNKISYTDAFNIVGVSYKGYKTLAGEGG